MCLSYRNLSKKRQTEILQQAKKRRYFRVYKVVVQYFCNGRKVTGPHYGKHYKSGAISTKNPGWHVFLDHKTAESYADWGGRKVVVCYAKTSWLNRLAYQNSTHDEAATFHTLVFPDWNKSDMTIQEFRAACKVKK